MGGGQFVGWRILGRLGLKFESLLSDAAEIADSLFLHVRGALGATFQLCPDRLISPLYRPARARLQGDKDGYSRVAL